MQKALSKNAKLNDNIQRKSVLIEYTYRKIKGRVYWYYRFFGQRKWTRQLTSYQEVPYAVLKPNWGDFTR